MTIKRKVRWLFYVLEEEENLNIVKLWFTVTGGRNGFGAKLANIFSTRFVIETADSSSKKQYTQEFCNNMREKSAPEIEKLSRSQDWTRITFYPDLEKFRMDVRANPYIINIKKLFCLK